MTSTVAVSARRRIGRLAPADPLVAQLEANRSSETAMLKPTKAPQEKQRAVREVEHVHQSEDQRQARMRRGRSSIPMARPATLSVK